MRKWIAAAIVAASTLHAAAPAMARDFFNKNTLLGWRQQTGPAVVAYFRAPLGPSTFKAPLRSGVALTGPRSYYGGEAQLYSQAPRLVDFAITKSGVDARWNAQLKIADKVAWTNERKKLQPGQIAAALATGTVTFNAKD